MIEGRDHNLAGRRLGHRIAGAGAHDLDDHASSTVMPWIASIRRRWCRRRPSVALQAGHALVDEHLAQGGRQRSAADEGLLQRGDVLAQLRRLLDQDLQERRRADIAVGPVRRWRRAGSSVLPTPPGTTAQPSARNAIPIMMPAA